MTKPRVWLVDFDGTLATMHGRSPYDMSRVGEDTPNHPVVMTAQALAAHPDVDGLVVVSGREETARRSSEAWLAFHDIPYLALYLRSRGDQRADALVKEEIFIALIEPRFSVIGVLDDRASVVRMWRSLGLTCLQVADGNF